MEPDDLFGLPLDEFTAARDQLAKELRAAGDREAAAAVKKLRKPNLVAWTLNQLARRNADGIEALLGAGDRLRVAQRRVMSGGKVDDLRTATEERKKAVSRLLDEAEKRLNEGGHATSASTLAGVQESLMAAATDEDGAQALRLGVLERELQPGEIPDLTPFTVIDSGEPATKTAQTRDRRKADDAHAEARRGLDEARDRARDAAEDAAAAGGRAEAARAEAEKLRSHADALEAEARRLLKEAEATRERARDADGEAQRAQQHAEELAGVLSRRRAEVEEAERAVEAAQRD